MEEVKTKELKQGFQQFMNSVLILKQFFEREMGKNRTEIEMKFLLEQEIPLQYLQNFSTELFGQH